jgi:hypothetical protein
MSSNAFDSNDDIAAQVGDLAAHACSDLFLAYGVELKRSALNLATSNEPMLCGVTGFVGRGISGTCLLAGTLGPLQASCPGGGRVRDWVGELANQLVGRLKSKLLRRSVELTVTTPVVLSGVRLEPLPRGALVPVTFSADSGTILVWVEVETASDFGFIGSEHPGRAGSEGDLLFF